MSNLIKYFLICFSIFFLSLSVYAKEKTEPVSTEKSSSKKIVEKQIKQVNQIPLTIKNITLKKNIIYITIATAKKLLPADYTGVTLYVATPWNKAGKKWSFQKIDYKRSLSRSGKTIIFNTKILLTKPGNVMATLAKGKWKTSKNQTLIPLKIMAANKNVNKKANPGKVAGIKAVGERLQGQDNKKNIIPMISEGNDMTRAPSSRANSRVADRFEENAGSDSNRYSTINATREALYLPISIIHPVGNDEVIWGYTRRISWTMPEEDEPSDCGNQVNIYAIREGTDNRIYITQVHTTPGSNNWGWLANPDNISIGRYHIEIESSEGCKIRGAAFEVKSCDYAVETVTFLSGRSLATGIDTREGSVITGTFRVKVRWNGIELPSTFAPGTEWGNRMTVRSILTGETINTPRLGTNFDYTDAAPTGIVGASSLINVDIPFQLTRDDIANMMTDSRNIPLEFSFEPIGASMDTDGSNNRLEADMKVLFAKIVDLQIMFYSDDFELERDRHWPGTAPVYDYQFFQSRVRVRNAAISSVGSAPADLLNVPVAWYIEWKPDGGSWSPAPISQGRFEYDIVSGDWTDPLNLTGNFSTVIDDPDRIYRLRMVIDPDNEYFDSNRSDNQFFNTFGNPD